MQALFCQCYHTLELWAFFQLRFLNNKFGNGAAWLHRETSEYGNNIRESQQKGGGVKRQPVPKCWQTCNTSHTLLRTKCRITLGVCTRLGRCRQNSTHFLGRQCSTSTVVTAATIFLGYSVYFSRQPASSVDFPLQPFSVTVIAALVSLLLP